MDNTVRKISSIPPRELPRARRRWRWKASRCMPLMALLFVVLSVLAMLPFIDWIVPTVLAWLGR